jgi:glycosyltransferase involved in cell wall biosynthesis
MKTIYYPSDEEESYVKQWLSEKGVTGKVVKTIPLYAYEKKPEAAVKNLTTRKNLLFVAGFGHPPNIDAAKWFVKNVMPLLRKTYPKLKLNLVGSNPTQEILNLQSESVHVTGFVSEARLIEIYSEVRVVVAPLLYGGGMKGKIVEALHHGVPCVTTSTGIQGLSGTSQFIGAYDNADDYARAVALLLVDDGIWRDVSSAGQAYVEKSFSERAMWNVIGSDVN